MRLIQQTKVAQGDLGQAPIRQRQPGLQLLRCPVRLQAGQSVLPLRRIKPEIELQPALLAQGFTCMTAQLGKGRIQVNDDMAVEASQRDGVVKQGQEMRDRLCSGHALRSIRLDDAPGLMDDLAAHRLIYFLQKKEIDHDPHPHH